MLLAFRFSHSSDIINSNLRIVISLAELHRETRQSSFITRGHKEQRASACDFQPFDILTNVDSDESLQPPFKLRNSKWCSVSSLTNIEIQATSKGSDQTARMRRLI